jgi:hypothetical protein
MKNYFIQILAVISWSFLLIVINVAYFFCEVFRAQPEDSSIKGAETCCCYN